MARDLKTLMTLEVPIVVRLGHRKMSVAEVLRLAPGAIIELPKTADEELELYINNVHVGFGSAVKVGENFGIQLTYVGDISERVEAIGADPSSGSSGSASDDDFAEQLLAGQL